MPLGNLFTFLNINFCFEDGLIVPISQIVVEIKWYQIKWYYI